MKLIAILTILAAWAIVHVCTTLGQQFQQIISGGLR